MSYHDRLNKLENDIYERTESNPWFGAMTSIVKVNQYKKYLPYSIILVLSFIILYLIRPRWILVRVSKHVHKICMTRFLIMWMVISSLLGTLYYKYGSSAYSNLAE
jgi:hypothetical protein